MTDNDPLASIRAEMDAERWTATLTRCGPWTWHIDPVKGIIGLRGGYLAFGSRKHAGRVARRKLARLERHDQRSRDAATVTGGTT